MGSRPTGIWGLAPLVATAARDHDADMPNIISLNVRAWWCRDELDQRLAHDADPASDPLLARRAAQLCSRSTRDDLAHSLESAVRDARSTWSLTARLPLRRAAVRECADDLIAVARRLRQPDPIDVAGAAMVSRLVFDGTSPMYRDGRTTLRYALRSARLALDPIDTVMPDVWAVA
jgi:hypothetical protein